MFFIASGMRLDVHSVFTADELVRVAIFFVLLLVARGLPALLYRRHIGTRGAVAAGLMQATNVSFIVVAVTVGVELKEMLPITASSLVVAGLLSALLFPAIAQSILARGYDFVQLADAKHTPGARSRHHAVRSYGRACLARTCSAIATSTSAMWCENHS